MSNKKKVIQSEQIKESTYRYVFEDLSYFTLDLVTFERWYYNKSGQSHREDGPAVEYANGTKFWCKNNQYHREDGPAIVWVGGDRSWWLNGKKYSEQEWKAELKRRSKNK